MKLLTNRTPFFLAAIAPAALFLPGATSPVIPQDSPSQHQQHQEQSAAEASELTIEQHITELRASVARLEAALDMEHRGTSQQASMQSTQSGMGMGQGAPAGLGSMGGKESGGMMQEMGTMGGMPPGGMKQGAGGMGSAGDMQSGGEMQGMPSAGSRGMGMGMGMGGMMGKMGKMGMGDMPTTSLQVSTLPGYPGASHIYHIGATGFFLDHGGHLVLSSEQQTRLNQAREAALLDQATSQRSVEQAEQELWSLTAADSPDAAQIDAKVRQIEMLRGDRRIAFIRAVGEAAGILTEDQQKQLSGMLPPGPPTSQSSSMSGMSSGK